MEVLEDKILTKYLFDKYSSNPDNWNFIVSTRSKSDGFFDATISNTDEVWQLKFDSIYKPTPIVLGAKVDINASILEKKIGANVPFGYRKLDNSIIMNFLNKISDNDSSENMSMVNQYINKVITSSPPVRPMEGNNYAYGPLILTPDSPIRYSDKQKLVSEKLTYKLKEKLRNRYSAYL